MLSQKFNVYKTEWLDLVFENRNQLYGAYELRKSYSSTLVKAMLAASIGLISLVTIPFTYQRYNSKTDIALQNASDGIVKLTEVNVLPKKELPKLETPKTEKQANPVKLKSVKFVTPQVVPASRAENDIPTIKELNTSVIATQNTDGELSSGAANPDDVVGNGSIGNSTNDPEGIFHNVENFPTFPGGMEAFYKYLGRSIRYPSMAQENNITGRIVVSFVIEKNGDLSNIHIIKGIGFGCDEEAIRVLKNAPLWNPGEQNGQKVRVQYTMPIVFRLGNE